MPQEWFEDALLLTLQLAMNETVHWYSKYSLVLLILMEAQSIRLSNYWAMRARLCLIQAIATWNLAMHFMYISSFILATYLGSGILRSTVHTHRYGHTQSCAYHKSKSWGDLLMVDWVLNFKSIRLWSPFSPGFLFHFCYLQMLGFLKLTQLL